MRKRIVLTVALLGGAMAAWILLSAPRPSKPPAPAETRDGRWRQDVDYLAAELARLHPAPFEKVSADEFGEGVTDLQARVPELEDHEIRVRLAALAATLGDAHTGVSASASDARRLPIWVRWFADGLFITHATGEHLHLRRSRILRIGSTSAEAALERVGTVLSHENAGRLRDQSASYLIDTDVLHGLGLIANRDYARLTVETPEGKEVDIVLPARSVEINELRSAADERPLYRQHADRQFWLRYLEPSRTLYFRYSDCHDPIGFWWFSRELKDALDGEEVNRLVIDMRDNPGGNSYQFSLLVLDDLKRRGAINRPGHLFVLINAGTFSSAMNNANQLRRETAAILVGEPTGSSPNGFGESRRLELPNSGIPVWYSTKAFVLDPERPGVTTVEPDLRIEVPSEAYFAGRDPVLEAVLEGLQPIDG